MLNERLKRNEGDKTYVEALSGHQEILGNERNMLLATGTAVSEGGCR